MLQPYLSRVDQLGETALVYFEGEFVVMRSARARCAEEKGRTDDEFFAKETITASVPDAAELSVGARALQALPFETPLYARVDLVRDQKDEPVVLELELIEPVCFLRFEVRSAESFAAAVVRRATGFTA